LNPYAGQMIILGGAKTMDGTTTGDSATPAQPREEVTPAQIDDDIPF